MEDDTIKPSFGQRLEQYRAMAGDTAWDQIADDWRAGKFDADEARAYADILFPIIIPDEPGSCCDCGGGGVIPDAEKTPAIGVGIWKTCPTCSQ